MKITTIQNFKRFHQAELDTEPALERSSRLLRVLLGFNTTALSAGKQVQLERAIIYLPEWKEWEEPEKPETERETTTTTTTKKHSTIHNAVNTSLDVTLHIRIHLMVIGLHDMDIMEKI